MNLESIRQVALRIAADTNRDTSVRELALVLGSLCSEITGCPPATPPEIQELKSDGPLTQGEIKVLADAGCPTWRSWFGADYSGATLSVEPDVLEYFILNRAKARFGDNISLHVLNRVKFGESDWTAEMFAYPCGGPAKCISANRLSRPRVLYALWRQIEEA